MAFSLFVILNAILLLRPEELFPALAGANLYLCVIFLCILVSFPQILEQATAPSLVNRPITVCVLGLLVSMALSKLSKGQLDVLDHQVPEFGKIVLYFLLFMANVNTPERMLRFMGWLVVTVIALTTIGLLQYHEVVDFGVEALQPLERKEYDPETGQLKLLYQFRYLGIYNDPNDLCLIFVTGTICAACCFVNSSPLIRLFWLCSIGLFVYGISLSQSRGGLLGFIAGLLTFIYARYGARKCLPWAILLVPAIIVFAGGRMSNMNVSGGDDTAQQRMRLWAEGMNLMLSNPLTIPFGIGVDQYAGEFGIVAHNSFVHAYVEMGLIGGTFFLGVFCLSALGMGKIREEVVAGEDPLVKSLYPFVFAMVVGYAAGCYTISRNFVLPTYMILGFAGSYIAFTSYDQVSGWFRFDKKMIKRLFILGVMGLLFLKFFTQSLVSWS
jgi:putative inorganic carbon (hco3(-)) transporter